MPHQIFKTCENIYEILYPCQYETAGTFPTFELTQMAIWKNRPNQMVQQKTEKD